MTTYAQEVAQEITWAKRREEERKETRKNRNRAERRKEWGGRRREARAAHSLGVGKRGVRGQ